MRLRSAGARTAGGALGALAGLAGLAMLLGACGGGRGDLPKTPTVIPQPTPDRTVDAVIRGAVHLSPVATPSLGGTRTVSTASSAPASNHLVVTATPPRQAPGYYLAPQPMHTPAAPRGAETTSASNGVAPRLSNEPVAPAAPAASAARQMVAPTPVPTRANVVPATPTVSMRAAPTASQGGATPSLGGSANTGQAPRISAPVGPTAAPAVAPAAAPTFGRSNATGRASQ